MDYIAAQQVIDLRLMMPMPGLHYDRECSRCGAPVATWARDDALPVICTRCLKGATNDTCR